jgi:hypothetical protein
MVWQFKFSRRPFALLMMDTPLQGDRPLAQPIPEYAAVSPAGPWTVGVDRASLAVVHATGKGETKVVLEGRNLFKPKPFCHHHLLWFQEGTFEDDSPVAKTAA